MSDLFALANELEAAYRVARVELERELAADAAQGVGYPSRMTPEQIRSPDGRFILLDALTAVVAARATLLSQHMALGKR